ncbi:CidA/LrgA family protein [Jeongeupia chitinilytica]|uniref:Murein hydrolase transporter LrgA n=1 Tax=Jeongeupia chitinilytica TaxID=1041641 RepID=A0ABQ3H1J5_9NEIS|nr:CidA/LrgA family protein [Jeongeupia chitinilytica]GHD65786.1 murein hydrolase transporter LrgA [Jeongeupia chitinilytica]
MLYGFCVLVLFQLIGEAASTLLHLPLPGPVLGMLLLAFWCVWHRGVDPRLAQVAQGLLGYMGLLFVPAGVGLMLLGPVLRDQGLAMLPVLVLSLVITMAVTALTMKAMLNRHRRKLRNRVLVRRKGKADER